MEDSYIVLDVLNSVMMVLPIVSRLCSQLRRAYIERVDTYDTAWRRALKYFYEKPRGGGARISVALPYKGLKVLCVERASGMVIRYDVKYKMSFMLTTSSTHRTLHITLFKGVDLNHITIRQSYDDRGVNTEITSTASDVDYDNDDAAGMTSTIRALVCCCVNSMFDYMVILDPSSPDYVGHIIAAPPFIRLMRSHSRERLEKMR